MVSGADWVLHCIEIYNSGYISKDGKIVLFFSLKNLKISMTKTLKKKQTKKLTGILNPKLKTTVYYEIMA